MEKQGPNNSNENDVFENYLAVIRHGERLDHALKYG